MTVTNGPLLVRSRGPAELMGKKLMPPNPEIAKMIWGWLDQLRAFSKSEYNKILDQCGLKRGDASLASQVNL